MREILTEKIKAELKFLILAIMKEWNSEEWDFDAYWKGYAALQRQVVKTYPVELNHLKKCMKELKSAGVIEYGPAYNTDYELSGSGYFYYPTAAKDQGAGGGHLLL